MLAIKNKEQLVKNGQTKLDRKARRLALESLESAITAADPEQIIKSKLKIKGATLQVNQHEFGLKEFKRVYVMGGGKASGSMAKALDQVLGSYVTRGLVNVPYGGGGKIGAIELHEASHPVPDESGVKGTRAMMKMAEGARVDDLIISLISGGGSSLMPLPRGEISIEDKRKLTDALLKCGATINEINTVRKHVSDFKGGWLAKKAFPATVLNLILSDVVGDPLDFIASGPTVPDSTTFDDAIRVLRDYSLWDNAPSSIRSVLMEGKNGKIPETPKSGDEIFKKVTNVIVGNNRLAGVAARDYLKSCGLNALLLTSTLEGVARDIGGMLASIAREVSLSGNPVSKPAGIVVGGETTVIVTGKGIGGRNQEVPLAAAAKVSNQEGLSIASLNTDGIDGPTDAAGAIVDGRTLARAVREGLTPERFLAENDSYNFFSKLGDLIFTGPTGTNVNDVSVVIVL